MVLLNTAIMSNTSTLSSSVTDTTQLEIYNSRVNGTLSMSRASSRTINEGDNLVVKNSIFPGATNPPYVGLFKSLSGSGTTATTNTIFSGFTVNTRPWNDDNYAIKVDMSDFVTTGKDQGDDDYYPESAADFNTRYCDGTLSDAAVNALETLGNGWNFDLAGNPRKNGTIDVGPYEE
jgi:hypothetical protein